MQVFVIRVILKRVHIQILDLANVLKLLDAQTSGREPKLDTIERHDIASDVEQVIFVRRMAGKEDLRLFGELMITVYKGIGWDEEVKRCEGASRSRCRMEAIWSVAMMWGYRVNKRAGSTEVLSAGNVREKSVTMD